MRATQNFARGTEHGEEFVYGGTVLDEDDPIVTAFRGLFEPVYETVSNPQTVDEPGPAAPVGRAVPRRRRG